MSLLTTHVDINLFFPYSKLCKLLTHGPSKTKEIPLEGKNSREWLKSQNII